MKRPLQLRLILTIGLILGACALPASTRPGLSVRLLSPRPGMVMVLPNTEMGLYAEANVPAQDVTRVIFYANGLVVGEDHSPVPSGIFTSSLLTWHPTVAGEYMVQAEAQRSDGSAFTAAARVCVLPAVLGSSYFFQTYGYTGPCELPPADPDAPVGLEVSMLAHAIPSSLAYDFLCPSAPASPTVAFEATLDDPSDRVVFVAVEYSDPDRANPGYTHAETISLNWTASSAGGEKIFTGTTVDLTSLLGPDLQSDGGNLTWTARAVGRSGELLAEDGPHDILASPCTAAVIGAAMPIVVEQTETFTPTPTLTPTPKIIPYVPPTKKPAGSGDGDGGGSGGSGGSSESGPVCKGLEMDKCNSTLGCTWIDSGCNPK
jgi:hypothetical protein